MRLLALLLAALALPASAAPSRVDATYVITAAGLTIGRVTEHFEQQGDTYRIVSTTRAEGVLKLFRDDTISVKSEGRVVASGLRPLRFEQRMALDPGRDIAATYDWANAVAHADYRGEHKSYPLPPGTQDRLSILYQFMNEHPKGDRVSMYMSNGRSKPELYTYRLVDTPRISTEAGEFATLHYARVTESEKENKGQLWLAKDHFNIPVRAVFEDTHGLRLEQSIVSLSVR
jgi:hypothetical protein